MMNLIDTLNKAYGATTQNNNIFKNTIESIKWECTFEADGEIYYQLGDLTLTVENLDPFKENYKPTIICNTFFKELGWM